MDIDDEWESFMCNPKQENINTFDKITSDAPIATDIYMMRRIISKKIYILFKI